MGFLCHHYPEAYKTSCESEHVLHIWNRALTIEVKGITQGIVYLFFCFFLLILI